MMRAYLAILKDSFRESLRSRVLWMLLVTITLLLMLLIPFDIAERSSWRLAQQDISSMREFGTLFIQRAASQQEPHITRMWESLDEETRERWQQRFAPTEGRGRHGPDIVDAMNHLMENEELYDATAWSGRDLSENAQALIDLRDRGETIDTLELNRRLLEDAFPGYIAESRGASYFLSYFGWEMPMPIATNRNQLQMLTNLTISTLISLVVGTAGVFVAILVTASMVPHTFASGSIDLLLSKPIARSLLYLTKFVGGCIFILVNAAYFLIGFWLITGLRLEVWTSRILWCLPVFLFLFGIYYSVSTLAGVIWRNTIICVAVSFLFWLLCFIVGNARESIEVFFLQPTRLQQLVPAGDDLLAINASGNLVVWNESSRNWLPASGSSARAGGPPFHENSSSLRWIIHDEQSDRLLGIQRSKNHVMFGHAADVYRLEQGASIPLGARQLYRETDGSLTVVCTHGIFRVEGDLETPAEESEPLKIGGFSLPIRRSKQFQSIGPPGWEGMGIQFALARSPVSTSLAIHDRGTVSVLDRGADGVYTQRFETKLEGDRDAEIGMTDKTIVVARHDGVIRLIDVPSQEMVAEFTPYEGERATHVTTSADGRWFVILFTGNTAALVDADQQRLASMRIPSQGSITAAAFAADGDQLLIADQRLRITAWSIGDNQRQSRCIPQSSTFESIYYWIINPIYKVFPKPAELTKLVQYILLKDTLGSGVLTRELGIEMTRSDIWNPIWSNVAFVAVVLLIGCVYVARKEF